MAKHLDLKSLIHLQLICRGLYAKCLYGQRLKVLEFDRIIVQERDNGERILTVGAEWERLHIQEWQLQATKFRFHANRLVFEGICEPADILKIQECLSGRGTVKKLILGVAAVNLDFNLFNQVLQNLKISQLQVGNLPAEFWQQPSVKQMTHLLCERNFPMSLAYLAETAFKICTIPNGGNDNSCLQLNTTLKKWADGQKKIKMWNIHVLDVREQQLFKDFLLVAEGDFQPLR